MMDITMSKYLLLFSSDIVLFGLSYCPFINIM